jgi:hypothetical protein
VVPLPIIPSIVRVSPQGHHERDNGSVGSRNISKLCKSLICRHSLTNAGEVVLVVYFIGECDSDSMRVALSGINFAKSIAKDSGVGSEARD